MEKEPPVSKLNIALIGVRGRGLAHYDSIAKENVVPLCDIKAARFPDTLKRFPAAKTHTDWRKRLEQKNIDAVVFCTEDHHHASIANSALNRVRELIRDGAIGELKSTAA